MMYKIRIHGRGGQGGKTAAKLIGLAAFYEGKQVQDFSVYGAERRGAPVASFVRIDSKEILERDYIVDPDCVIILDESLLKEPEVGALKGLDPGDVLIINTKKKIKAPKGVKLYTVDATSIALETIKRPVFNTAMIGAFAKVTRVIELESVNRAIEHKLSRHYKQFIEPNIRAVKKCYDAIKVR